MTIKGTACSRYQTKKEIKKKHLAKWQFNIIGRIIKNMMMM